ncbi:hypothetical protein L1987_56453 [Smallanthus sonchifolius]|uniref:Uncharacterized protein n=1 Tax=Smallanthus sonchifolius TaxID=185202 RepID=A0ACB9ECX7_9ASTR|nr:hypothetical protein L1987_56453 [Smallanthus sonchifolius]
MNTRISEHPFRAVMIGDCDCAYKSIFASSEYQKPKIIVANSRRSGRFATYSTVSVTLQWWMLKIPTKTLKYGKLRSLLRH